MGHDAFNEDVVGSIIPYVDRNYLTVDDRDHRALAGLSRGGLQTLTLSLTNSALTSYIGVFSSGWFPQMREEVEKTDLALYKAKGQPFRLYWVGAGKYDIAKSNSGASVELLKKYAVNPLIHGQRRLSCLEQLARLPGPVRPATLPTDHPRSTLRGRVFPVARKDNDPAAYPVQT